MLGTVLIVILILALLGAFPTWGHSRDWGLFSQWRFRYRSTDRCYTVIVRQNLILTRSSECIKVAT
jgi:hypothetical protein